MIFGSSSWTHQKSGVEQVKADKNDAAIELKRREQEKFASLHEARNKACLKYNMKSRNKALETIFTRDDIEALKMVQEFGGQEMIKGLGDAKRAIQQQEARFFLSEYSTAWEGAESQPECTKGTDLIHMPSHTTDTLMNKGFTRKQARMIQNEIAVMEASKTTKTCLVVTAQQQKDFRIQPMATRKEEVESAIAMGWRPEHPALFQRLQRCNDLITRSIPTWEQEELLAEWIDAFWYSDNYEKDMEVFNNCIPEVDFLSPATMAMLGEEYYQDRFQRHFSSILATNPDLKLRYEKLDSRRQMTVKTLVEDDDIETWYDARMEAIAKAKETKISHDSQLGKNNSQNKLTGLVDDSFECGWEACEWTAERLRYVKRRAKFNREAEFKATAAASSTPIPTAKFEAWDKETFTALADKRRLETFPAPPIKCCSMACNKKKGLLDFCEHSLEKFMQGSGARSLEEKMQRLKFEERRFHPDRFMMCRVEVRDSIVKMAGEMFQILKALEVEDEEA